MSDLLTLDKVALSYHTASGETEALKSVSFSARRGEFLSIVGPSGCGKTTILSVVAGLLTPTSGSVLLDGAPVGPPDGNVGYMLQRDTLFEWLTVCANTLLGLRVQKKLTDESRAYARSLIDKYGLGEFADSYPTRLSGGMRQRAALVRTLAFRPKLLLLDEPFSALDFQTRTDVAEDVRGIIAQEGVTTLLVTHDVPEAVCMGDRIVLLSPRPAVVKEIVDVGIPGTPSERRASPRSARLAEEIMEKLRREDG